MTTDVTIDVTTDVKQRARRLLQILDLEEIEQNLFRGQNEKTGDHRLFGGQVLAQALRAALNTVDGRAPHSLHADFLRAGRASLPVLYEVDPIRTGRSFTTRRVVAIQDGEAIFSMSASFHVNEDGLSHAQPIPNVPLPEELQDDVEAARALGEDAGSTAFAIERPFEVRSVYQVGSEMAGKSRLLNPVWIRFPEPVSADEPDLLYCLLAYASDMGMVSTGLLPHLSELRDKKIQRQDLMLASLDHALWIHRPIPVGDWLLFSKKTTTAVGARAMCHGEFHARDGTLVASVSQEGLVRTRKP